MTTNQEAKSVLMRALEEVILETARSGSAGGVGRAGSYAPQINALYNAICVVDALQDETQTGVNDRMAAVRAARKQFTKTQG